MISAACLPLQSLEFMSVKQACRQRKQPFPCKRAKWERNQDDEGKMLDPVFTGKL